MKGGNDSGSKFRGSRFKVRLMKDVYEQARRIQRGGTAVSGFINYLKKYEERKETNREP